MPSTPPLPVSVFGGGPPVTPIQTSHHSFAITPVDVPIHTLSLHEYRKQQRSPDLPHQVEGPSLRRKPGTPQLNPERPASTRPIRERHPYEGKTGLRQFASTETIHRLKKKTGIGQLKAQARPGPPANAKQTSVQPSIAQPQQYYQGTPDVSPLSAHRVARGNGDLRPYDGARSASISPLSFRTAEPYLNLSTRNIASREHAFATNAHVDKENLPPVDSHVFTTFADHTRSMPSSSFHIHKHFPPLPVKTSSQPKNFSRNDQKGDPRLLEASKQYHQFSTLNPFSGPSFAPTTMSGLAQSVGGYDHEHPLSLAGNIFQEQQNYFYDTSQGLLYEPHHFDELPRSQRLHSPFSYHSQLDGNARSDTPYELRIPDQSEDRSFLSVPTDRQQPSPTPQKGAHQHHQSNVSGSLEHVLRHKREPSDRYPILVPSAPLPMEPKVVSPKSRLQSILPSQKQDPHYLMTINAKGKHELKRPVSSKSHPILPSHTSNVSSASSLPRQVTQPNATPFPRYDGPLQSRFSFDPTSSVSHAENHDLPVEESVYSLSSFLTESSSKSPSPVSGWTSHGRFDSHQSTTIQGDFDSFYRLYDNSSRNTSASFKSRKRLPRPDDARTVSSSISSRPSMVQVHHQGASFDLLNPHNSLEVSVVKDVSDDEDLGSPERANTKKVGKEEVLKVQSKPGSATALSKGKAPENSILAATNPLERATQAEKNALKNFKFPPMIPQKDAPSSQQTTQTTDTDFSAFHDTSSIINRYGGPDFPLPPVPALLRDERNEATPLTLPPTINPTPTESYGDTRDLLNPSFALLKPLSTTDLPLHCIPHGSKIPSRDPEKQTPDPEVRMLLSVPAPTHKIRKALNSPFFEWMAKAGREEDVGWRRFSIEAQLRSKEQSTSRTKGWRTKLQYWSTCEGPGGRLWIILVAICCFVSVAIGVGVGIWRAIK